MLLSMYLLFTVQSILAMLFCTLRFRKKFHKKKQKMLLYLEPIVHAHATLADLALVEQV